MGAHGNRLTVEVLGPLRVHDLDGRDVTPEGSLQRRLLALLVLRRGHVVSVESAIDALWPTRPPRDPVAALHNHLFRLRRVLPEGVIASTGDGYRLDPAWVDVDADRLFAVLEAAESADAGADPAALGSLDAVLARWRGPAYPELDEIDDGRVEAARLDELRIRVLEARAALKLAAGETVELAAELAALVDAEPLRERPRSLLMATLAATGRHAEALRVYDDFRRLLGDELGIEPSPVLAAQHDALLAGAPAGASLATIAWTPPTRLPLPATSLIGRDAVVDDLLAVAGQQRVVTLVGPGGVGKTRLLIEVGHRLRAARPDRPVVICELSSAVEDSALDAVAAALGIDGRPDVDPREHLTTVLGDSGATLLLDNCEHVLEPVASLVERIVTRCPNVTLLTTSRERLRVQGERVYVVPALEADGNDGAAVDLFLERARAAAPDVEPDDADLAVIGDIVRRLDGLPLAIELAAARLHTHDLAEVAAGLDHRFALLSSGFRTSARHGSLHAAVSWSFDLLDRDLQATFADLSVFAGPFRAGDAAAVCDADDAAIVATLGELCERSLLTRVPGRRYVLLETLRAFGAEQLRASGRHDDTGGRHARHHVDWIERTIRQLVEPGGTPLADVDDALPELRSALGWLLDHHELALAGRLAVALRDYGFFRLRPDVLAWSERVAAADPDDRSPLAARVWATAAYAAWMAGDLGELRTRSTRALQIVERAGDDVPAEVASAWGSCALFDGELDEAARWFRRTRDAARTPGQRLQARAAELLALGYAGDPSVGDVAEAALAEVGAFDTPHAAYLWYCAGEAVLAADVELARARYARALDIADRTHASFVTGIAGASKASIDARVGDPHATAEAYRRLVVHWRRAGMWSTQWTMLRSIAGLLARLGRMHDAAVLEGAVRATRAGHRIFGADEVALSELGATLRAALGDEGYERARQEGARLDGDAAVEHALRSL